MNWLFEQIIGYKSDQSVLLFDYDSTIAKVPVDWPQARAAYRDYLLSEFPELSLPAAARVDELEAFALRYAPSAKERVFSFRFEMESALDGGHEPLTAVCECIRLLAEESKQRLFIISNNLHRTVDVGLNQLGLSDAFEGIFGVDDVGVPKPDTRAFEMLQESYGLLVNQCIFIGDNDRTDGGFCRALGIPFINVED